jgi:hypothetical protein
MEFVTGSENLGLKIEDLLIDKVSKEVAAGKRQL